MTQIIGSGGGGGKGDKGGNRTPTTDPDSLDSKSYAKVLDLLSEGEIEGLKDGHKSIYLDNTPLQNTDGSYNFEDVTITTREGTSSQTKINGFDEASNTISVNTEVTKGDPNIGVTRTVSTSDSHDAVRVLVRFPALQKIEDDGDIVGTSVAIKVQMQVDGGGFVDKISETITGRTGDQYKKSYLITLPDTYTTGVEIRVLRTTDNSGDAKLQNATFFDSYVIITYTNNTYPNSALAAIRVNAEQFSSIPQRSYIIRGIKTKIPNNCTVDSATGRLIYDGTAWSGTFQAATWNSCPAFALYDLLISGRYGLGDHISESQLSKFDFYAASKYANELVADGFGGSGQEARFSCNIAIRSRAEAFNLINSMTSVFRAMSYWSAGSLAISQDKPVTSSSCLFTLANVTPEGFVYQGSSQKTRATTVVVKYFDMNLRNYAYEEVKDDASMFNGIAKYGKIVKNVEAFACTSRGQANRVGRWMIYSEAQETETVTFATSIDSGIICRPGQVIDIADPVKSGFRRGGRIKAATVSDITVDGTNGVDTDLPQGTVASLGYTRTLHILRSNGSVESRPVSNISGAIITVETDFTDAPNVNGLWILETTGGTSAQNIESTQWRVISVTEEDGNVYAINALSYNSSKYANVESGIALTVRDFSNLNEIPAAPVNLRIFQQLYIKGNEIKAKVVFSWDAVLGVNEYEVRTRKDSGTWKVHRQQGPDDEILDITAGTYEVKIFSLNAARVPSSTALTGSVNAAGKVRVPSDVTNFAYTLDPRHGFVLHWDKLVATYPHFDDLDVVGYEIRTTDAEWGLTNNDYYDFASPVAGENLIARVTANSYRLGYTPPGSRSYYVKAYDSEDRYSLNAASLSIAILAPINPSASATIEGNNVVITWSKVSTTARYAIDYYQVSKSSTFATVLEELDTTVYKREVDWTGSQTFYVRAVDIAGNFSVANSVTIQNTQASNYNLAVNYNSGTSAELTWLERNGGTPTIAYQVAHSATSISSFGEATGNQQIQGTTFSFLVNWTTAKRFWIRSVDAQGNTGMEEYVDINFSVPSAVTNLTTTFKGKTGNALLKSELEISWDAATKGALNIEEYEIRRGSTFAGATVISTIKSLSTTTQVDWNGTQTFWVVAKDINGNYGAEAFEPATVTPPAAVGAFTQEVIDNNVLLNWTEAESILPILYYNIKKGSSYASGSTIGTKQGLFTTVFETISGTFTYWIAAIDSASNVGTPEQVSATVNQPPDYILRKNVDSTFVSQGSVPTTVTSSNAFADQGNLFVNVDTTRTYQEHFIGTGSGGSPQYPNWNSYGANAIYGLPSATSGFYQEILDYGTTLAGTKIVSTLTGTHEAGSTSITPQISISTDNSSYTDYTGVATTSSSSTHNAFGTSFRYVKFRYDFASAGNDDLLKITAFNMRLETKQKTDSGSGTASASDSGGTTVNFSTSVGGGTYFVDVVSITVTPKGSSAPVIAIYDFTDTPNPTSFKVLLYNTSGTRVSGDFSWTARGN